ncbi:MAG: carboxypeptidase regulatory-like domain-containing protein [Acidobacteriota bacterium]
MSRTSATAALALVLAGACVSGPPPTDEARRLARNERATVEGRVTDADGRPVQGVRVQAVPGGRDVIWAPPAPTDAEGRFRLMLDAPAQYVFLIYVDKVAVLTPSPRDPARVEIFVQPGEKRTGVELTLLREERERLLDPGQPLR